MLAVRTNHDRVTSCLYHWTSPLIKLAEAKSLKVISLEGDKVTKDNIRGRISTRKPSFFFFNGHGSASAMFGNKWEEVITLKDADAFKEMVVFARACDCLQELGKEAVRKGCKAFVGYEKKFWIASLNEMASRPLNDPLTKPIMANSNLVAEELIKGRTVKEAIDKAHEHAAKLILDLVFSDDPYKSPALAAIVNNDSVLNYEGEESARIK
ncbi:hypothetical protein HYU12_02680 [Candidatus Woesearchaeota archaeon]|nr:hypothetical protein [Candidatus Woesearchaeota archaeon]